MSQKQVLHVIPAIVVTIFHKTFGLLTLLNLRVAGS